MKLSILITLLPYTKGFTPVHRIGLTSTLPFTSNKDIRCVSPRLPFGLSAVQDDTLEQTARSLFDVYANEEGVMDLNGVMDVPFVKELLVSLFAMLMSGNVYIDVQFVVIALMLLNNSCANEVKLALFPMKGYLS
jgi:hypothetical protein